MYQDGKSQSFVQSISPTIKKAPVNEQGVLQEDLLFTSPSYAAMFVIGKSANGLTSWKTSDGKTLKMLEAEQEI